MKFINISIIDIIMEDEFCYLDIVALKRIDTKTTIENFGTIVNLSFFEGANLLGSLKLRGLIEAESKFPGPSVVKVSKNGAKLIKMIDKVSKDSLKEVDLAIIKSVRKGNRLEEELEEELVLSKKDIATHLNKLKEQEFIDFTVKNGKIFLSLTDKGFEMINNEIKEIVEEPVKEDVEEKAENKPVEKKKEKKEELEILTKLKEELKYVLYSHSTGILLFFLMLIFLVIVLFTGA